MANLFSGNQRLNRLRQASDRFRLRVCTKSAKSTNCCRKLGSWEAKVSGGTEAIRTICTEHK